MPSLSQAAKRENLSKATNPQAVKNGQPSETPSAAILESCEYRFIHEYHESLWIGTYRSSISNDHFTVVSRSYCRPTVNL